ncbi:MAG: two-component system sensor histidine kinase DegS [Flavobacteriales bacterium]
MTILLLANNDSQQCIFNIEINLKYIILICSVLLGSQSLRGQSTSDDFRIAKTLIALEFEEATALIKIIKNKEVRHSYQVLRQLLYHTGNNKEVDALAYETLLRNKQPDSLTKLIGAFYNLYYHKRDPFVLRYLDDAFITTKTSSNKNLHKLSLIAFLHFYAKENTLDKVSFQEYLNLYKEMSTTAVDEAWTAYFENMHEGRVVEWDKDFFYQLGRANLEILEKHQPNLTQGIKANLYENIGIHYRVHKQADSAIYYFDKILNLPDLPYLKENKFAAGLDMGDIFVKKGNALRATYYFNKSLENINLADDKKNLVTYYKFKAHYFFVPTGAKDSAYGYLNKAFNLNRRINYEENSTNTSMLNVELRTAEKEKEIIKKENENLELEIKRKRNLDIAIALGSSLVLGSIIAVLVYRNTKRKQHIAEQAQELEVQKTEKVLKEKEIETINAMVSGQEKERHRLARELHDNLGSTLATVRMQVENLERNLDKVDNPKALLTKTHTLINEAYEKVRTISHERNAGVLAKDGLLPAIQRLATSISSEDGLHIEVEDFGLEQRLSNDLEITIFRIVQELVTNIIKHAKATEATISLTQHEGELNILIEDNGKGFKVGTLQHKDGMGLGSIERRVEHLEGLMSVDSTPGRGTHIIIDIPL